MYTKSNRCTGTSNCKLCFLLRYMSLLGNTLFNRKQYAVFDAYLPSSTIVISTHYVGTKYSTIVSNSARVIVSFQSYT